MADRTHGMEAERAAVAEALRRQAPDLVAAAKALAATFQGGGTLFAAGEGPFAADAEHVAVEFLHPVIVGNPALPAYALTGPVDRSFSTRFAGLGRAGDAAVVVGRRPDPGPLGVCVALTHGAAHQRVDHGVFLPTPDVWLAKEGFVACYHLLWEMTHLFLARGGIDAGDLGETSSLYPFLAGDAGPPQDETALASCRAKLEEIIELRARTLRAEDERLDACARSLAVAVRGGGRVFACGNGGSSTDAASFVDALTRDDRHGRVPAWTLTADRATVTALANDLGYERVFARQVAALGQVGDVVVGLSTSGNSANLLQAFDAAREQGLTTMGFAGYEGGDMASSGLVDELFVVPSASVHRIQEVQATLYLTLAQRARAALTPGPSARPPRRPPGPG